MPKETIAVKNKQYFKQLSIDSEDPSVIPTDDSDACYNDEEAVDKAHKDLFEAQEVLKRACGVDSLTRGNLTVPEKTKQLQETLNKEVPRLKELVKDVEEKKNEYTELVRNQRDLETQLNKLTDMDADKSAVQEKFDLATRDVEDAEKRLEEAKATGRERQQKLKDFLTSHVKELEDEMAALQKALDNKTKNFTLKDFKVTNMGDADFDSFLIESKTHCLAEFERLGCSHASNYLESLTRLEKEIFNESRLMYAVCFSQLHHVMDKIGNIAKLLGQVFKPRLNMGIFGVDVFNWTIWTIW